MSALAVDDASVSEYRLSGHERWNCKAGEAEEEGLIKEKEGQEALWIRGDKIWEPLEATIGENESPDNPKQRKSKRKPIAKMVQTYYNKAAVISF